MGSSGEGAGYNNPKTRHIFIQPQWKVFIQFQGFFRFSPRKFKDLITFKHTYNAFSVCLFVCLSFLPQRPITAQRNKRKADRKHFPVSCPSLSPQITICLSLRLNGRKRASILVTLSPLDPSIFPSRTHSSTQQLNSLTKFLVRQ